MDRIARLPFGLAAAATLLCVSIAAQTANQPSPASQEGERATQFEPQTPFPLGKEAPPPETDVEFRSPEQMSAADRQLEAASESAIAEHAGFENLQLSEGNWNYQQIVCRALPNHLFLRFTRNNGAGDRSLFSVSLPRNGKGRLRVIPVLRRGYSLFSPAPRNQGTVATFNQIRREDGPDATVGWLETALCYAALAGANPSVGTLTGEAMFTQPSPPLAAMVVTLDGGAIITFTDQAAQPHPIQWQMTFNPKGMLTKVHREPARLNTHWIVPDGQKKQSEAAASTAPSSGESTESKNSAPPERPVSRRSR